jgi:ATP-binding cassette subfamily B multidrug efflux pump
VAGGLTTGQLMAYINYLTQLLMSLLMVSILLIRFSRAEASAGRIVEILDTVPELKSPAKPVRPVRDAGRIEFDRVCFSYGGDGDETDALYDVSLVLEPGTTTAVVGTTGSGKSTMLNLIPRMYDVTSGRILFDGVDVREMDLSCLRGRIGMVPQEAVLFSGTIGENISYGKPDASEAEILEAARTAQAEEFILRAENGLGTVLSQRGMNLSGGQKQRLAIARALLPDPALLVLDDSLSALDADTAARLQKALARSRRGKTTLIVAQRIAQVAACDSIIVLDNGRIVDQAPHAALVSRCGLYREIVRSQNGGEGDG